MGPSSTNREFPEMLTKPMELFLKYENWNLPDFPDFGSRENFDTLYFSWAT
jgi:hypothetical protein